MNTQEQTLFCLIFIRDGSAYFTDWMTLFDWLGLLLILCIIPHTVHSQQVTVDGGFLSLPFQRLEDI